jgi:hypothetical protein
LNKTINKTSSTVPESPENYEILTNDEPNNSKTNSPLTRPTSIISTTDSTTHMSLKSGIKTGGQSNNQNSNTTSKQQTPQPQQHQHTRNTSIKKLKNFFGEKVNKFNNNKNSINTLVKFSSSCFFISKDSRCFASS